MSPEQVRGKTAGSHTDIFSLGVVLYELVAGRHRFAADSQVGVIHAVLSQAPLPLSHLNAGIPASLDTLISAMLEKEACPSPKSHPKVGVVNPNRVRLFARSRKKAGRVDAE